MRKAFTDKAFVNDAERRSLKVGEKAVVIAFPVAKAVSEAVKGKAGHKAKRGRGEGKDGGLCRRL
jgi:hypothetical protein